MKKYTKPILREHGSVEQMTRSTNAGTQLDQSFAAGTPLTDILDHGLS